MDKEQLEQLLKHLQSCVQIVSSLLVGDKEEELFGEPSKIDINIPNIEGIIEEESVTSFTLEHNEEVEEDIIVDEDIEVDDLF